MLLTEEVVQPYQHGSIEVRSILGVPLRTGQITALEFSGGKLTPQLLTIGFISSVPGEGWSQIKLRTSLMEATIVDGLLCLKLSHATEDIFLTPAP